MKFYTQEGKLCFYNFTDYIVQVPCLETTKLLKTCACFANKTRVWIYISGVSVMLFRGTALTKCQGQNTNLLESKLQSYQIVTAYNITEFES